MNVFSDRLISRARCFLWERFSIGFTWNGKGKRAGCYLWWKHENSLLLTSPFSLRSYLIPGSNRDEKILNQSGLFGFRQNAYVSLTFAVNASPTKKFCEISLSSNFWLTRRNAVFKWYSAEIQWKEVTNQTEWSMMQRNSQIASHWLKCGPWMSQNLDAWFKIRDTRTACLMYIMNK